MSQSFHCIICRHHGRDKTDFTRKYSLQKHIEQYHINDPQLTPEFQNWVLESLKKSLPGAPSKTPVKTSTKCLFDSPVNTPNADIQKSFSSSSEGLAIGNHARTVTDRLSSERWPQSFQSAASGSLRSQTASAALARTAGQPDTVATPVCNMATASVIQGAAESAKSQAASTASPQHLRGVSSENSSGQPPAARIGRIGEPADYHLRLTKPNPIPVGRGELLSFEEIQRIVRPPGSPYHPVTRQELLKEIKGRRVYETVTWTGKYDQANHEYVYRERYYPGVYQDETVHYSLFRLNPPKDRAPGYTWSPTTSDVPDLVWFPSELKRFDEEGEIVRTHPELPHCVIFYLDEQKSSPDEFFWEWEDDEWFERNLIRYRQKGGKESDFLNKAIRLNSLEESMRQHKKTIIRTRMAAHYQKRFGQLATGRSGPLHGPTPPATVSEKDRVRSQQPSGTVSAAPTRALSYESEVMARATPHGKGRTETYQLRQKYDGSQLADLAKHRRYVANAPYGYRIVEWGPNWRQEATEAMKGLPSVEYGPEKMVLPTAPSRPVSAPPKPAPVKQTTPPVCVITTYRDDTVPRLPNGRPVLAWFGDETQYAPRAVDRVDYYRLLVELEQGDPIRAVTFIRECQSRGVEGMVAMIDRIHFGTLSPKQFPVQLREGPKGPVLVYRVYGENRYQTAYNDRLLADLICNCLDAYLRVLCPTLTVDQIIEGACPIELNENDLKKDLYQEMIACKEAKYRHLVQAELIKLLQNKPKQYQQHRLNSTGGDVALSLTAANLEEYQSDDFSE